MAQITIIDDDLAMEILAENLRYLGHNVERFSSAKDALENIDAIVNRDLIVLDIIMERPIDAQNAGISGVLTTGMEIYQSVRTKHSHLPIIVHSATTDTGLVNLLSRDPYTTFLSKWSSPSLADVISRIEAALGIKSSIPPPRAFIVHGHDEETKLAVKNYLQNTLKLPEPIILHEQPNLGRTVIEKFEHHAAQSNLAFIVLTPDDKIADANSSNDGKRRARQNVIFELGFFLGTLGRSTGRIFLLHKGPLDLPSDLSGVIYIDVTNGVEAAGEKIRKELEHVLR